MRVCADASLPHPTPPHSLSVRQTTSTRWRARSSLCQLARAGPRFEAAVFRLGVVMKTGSVARWESGTQTRWLSGKQRAEFPTSSRPALELSKCEPLLLPRSWFYLLIRGGVHHDILLLAVCSDEPSWNRICWCEWEKWILTSNVQSRS